MQRKVAAQPREGEAQEYGEGRARAGSREGSEVPSAISHFPIKSCLSHQQRNFRGKQQLRSRNHKAEAALTDSNQNQLVPCQYHQQTLPGNTRPCPASPDPAWHHHGSVQGGEAPQIEGSGITPSLQPSDHLP